MKQKVQVVWLWIGLALALAAPAAPAELVFSAPPREAGAGGDDSYGPIADFIAKVVGQKVVYQNPGNWLTYQSEMRKGQYDIVFDGPAFIGWRMSHLDHQPLVKFPGELSFVVIVRKDQGKISELKDLAGRTLCAHAPPNLATLTVQFEFDNPMRQPLVLETMGFPSAYKGVVSGRCVGAILQGKILAELDKEAQAVKVVFKSKGLPNQAFSAGPRLGPEMREKLSAALLSPEGLQATEKLRARFKIKEFVRAQPQEYAGLGKLMRDVYGFDDNAADKTAKHR